MLCEKCKVKQATYHSTININGVVQESHLCNECAISENKTSNLFNMGNFFDSSLFLNPTEIFKNSLENELKSLDICNVCGKTYNEFLETGLLGCENCYKAFNNKLLPIINTMHNSTKHIGKRPLKEQIKDEHLLKIKNLEYKLKQAVANENYELASELKKQINALKEQEFEKERNNKSFDDFSNNFSEDR